MEITRQQIEDAWYETVEEVQHENVQGRCGSGRVYLEIREPKLRANSKIGALFADLGLKQTSRPYHTGKSRLYMGYDNNTGYEYRRAEIFKTKLQALGFKCYVDGDAD